MMYKKELIELFKKSCNDMNIERNEYFIKNNVKTKLLLKLFNSSEVINTNPLENKLTWDNIERGNSIGFEFKELPSLTIGSVELIHKWQYGKFFPIISYFYPSNYINRKMLTKYCDILRSNNLIFTEYYIDTLLKYINLWERKFFIIQGTLMEEITIEEYLELSNLYNKKVKEYDVHILHKRLNK